MNAATQNRLFAEDGVTTEISVRGLRTAFGDHVVHDNLDLTVFRGEIMVLVGGSGTGKTVLLRQIIGLERPAAGSVRVLGQSLFDLAPAERRRLSYRWGMLFQAGALFSALSVYDNVALAARTARHSRRSGARRGDVPAGWRWPVGAGCRQAAVGPVRRHGQRVALARALSLDPELVFLDEPTAGLDPLRSDEFVDLVRSLHRQLGFTVVMVTHDLDTLLALATRVAVLADKRVIVCDTVPEVLKFDHPFIHTFFLGERGLRALGDLAPKGLQHGKP